jgi:hypothetical protein
VACTRTTRPLRHRFLYGLRTEVIALGHRAKYRQRLGKRKCCRRERQPLAAIIRTSHRKETEGTTPRVGNRYTAALPIVRRYEGSCYHSHPRPWHPIMAMNSGHHQRNGTYDVQSPLQERTSGTHLWRSSRRLGLIWGRAIPKRRRGGEGSATRRSQPLSIQSRRELKKDLLRPIQGGYSSHGAMRGN